MILERMLVSGIYHPKIMYKNINRKGNELKAAGLLEDGMKVLDLFEDDDIVKPLAGEIPVEVPVVRRERRVRQSQRRVATVKVDNEGDSDEDEVEGARKLTAEDIHEVEELLKSLCQSIVDEWNRRMVQSPLALATCEVVGKAVPLENDVDLYTEKLRNNLSLILKELPPDLQERFQVVELLDGYSSYMEAFRQLEDNLKVNEIYMQWYRLHLEAGKEEETDSSMRNFADFFECVQVRCNKKNCVM